MENCILNTTADRVLDGNTRGCRPISGKRLRAGTHAGTMMQRCWIWIALIFSGEGLCTLGTIQRIAHNARHNAKLKKDFKFLFDRHTAVTDVGSQFEYAARLFQSRKFEMELCKSLQILKLPTSKNGL